MYSGDVLEFCSINLLNVSATAKGFRDGIDVCFSIELLTEPARCTSMAPRSEKVRNLL